MQRDKVRSKIERIIGELEEIQSEINLKTLEEALENLKIALKEIESFSRKGSESYLHYDLKVKLLEMFEGSHYLEGERTKLSNFGFRPDVVVIREKEVLIIEIEREKRSLLRKVKKLKKVKDKVRESPIFTGRKLKFVFGIVGFDLDENLKKELLKLGEVEVYTVAQENLKRLL